MFTLRHVMEHDISIPYVRHQWQAIRGGRLERGFSGGWDSTDEWMLTIVDNLNWLTIIFMGTIMVKTNENHNDNYENPMKIPS